jgi:hypothetical protein
MVIYFPLNGLNKILMACSTVSTIAIDMINKTPMLAVNKRKIKGARYTNAAIDTSMRVTSSSPLMLRSSQVYIIIGLIVLPMNFFLKLHRLQILDFVYQLPCNTAHLFKPRRGHESVISLYFLNIT